MGQYADAINSFEHIMNEQADFTTGLNLILCYYAVSDREKIRKCFQRILQIDTGIDDEDRYFPTMVSLDPPSSSVIHRPVVSPEYIYEYLDPKLCNPLSIIFSVVPQKKSSSFVCYCCLFVCFSTREVGFLFLTGENYATHMVSDLQH